MPRQTSRRAPRTSDRDIARTLRQAALELAAALPEKIDSAPLNQLASALKTTVEVINMLEAPDEAKQEQVIRWEFVYDGAVHAAPPWAGGSDVPSGPLSSGGVRAALGQNGAGQGGPD